MPTLQLRLQVPIEVVCVACRQKFQMPAREQMKQKPVLSCPGCGFKVQLEAAPVPTPGPMGKLPFPGYRPAPKA